MDLSKLSNGDKLAAVSGIVLLIVSFFTWFEATVGDVTIPGTGESGWGNLLGIVGILAGVAVALIALLPAFGVQIPPALAAPRTVLILGSVCLVAIVGTVFLTGYDAPAGFEDPGTSRKIGAWLGLLASIGVLAGVILKRKEAAGSAPSAPPAPPTA